MGKKKGLAAIFSKPNKLADSSPSPPWPWPSCANNPQTASFHRQDDDRPCTTAGRFLAAAASGRLLVPPRKTPGDMYKTANSVYCDPADYSSSRFSFIDDQDGDGDALDDCVSYSTATASEEWSEAVIRSLGRRASTDRFFFDSGPPPPSNSILAASRSPSPGRTTTLVTQQSSPPPEPNKAAVTMPDDDTEEGDYDPDADVEIEEEEDPPAASALVEESVAVALDSDDPYGDFRASMEEMVSAHGLRDWASLQELLTWYLRVNAKHNHALIVGAFVDLLVGLATTGDATATTTTTTSVTMTTTTAPTGSSSGSSSSSSSVAGDGATTCSTSATTATTVEEQFRCGGGGGGGSISGTDASCSPSPAVSSDQEDEEETVVVGKKKKDLLALHVKLCTA